jgi:hypothetical protein
MRDRILGVIGGHYYYESPVVFTIGRYRCIWWNRDEEGNLLFNLRVPGFSDVARPVIEDNWWSVLPGDVAELEAPPNGRKITVSYPNGDEFSVEFSSVPSVEDFLRLHPGFQPEWSDQLEFPLTIMQVYETIADADIELSPTRISIGGQMQAVMEGGFFANNGVAAIGINDPSAVFGLSVTPQAAERLMKGLRLSPDPDPGATPIIHRQQSVSLLRRVHCGLRSECAGQLRPLTNLRRLTPAPLSAATRSRSPSRAHWEPVGAVD